MRIAVCFFGKARAIDENYENIKNTFEAVGVSVDYYISTWHEDGVDIDKKLTAYFKPKYINVEKNSLDLNKGIELFGTFYPMMYKKLDVISNVPDDYDLVILTRMDLSYDQKFSLDHYNPKFLYSGSGFYSYKKEGCYHQVWKEKTYPLKEYFYIYKNDLNVTCFPSISYVEPVCDQFYVSSIYNLREYVDLFSILKKYLDEYNAVSFKRKLFQAKVDALFSFFSKSHLAFMIYRYLSIRFGFYIPFWVGLNKCKMARFKPTLMAYQVAFRGLRKKDTSFPYRVKR